MAKQPVPAIRQSPPRPIAVSNACSESADGSGEPAARIHPLAFSVVDAQWVSPRQRHGRRTLRASHPAAAPGADASIRRSGEAHVQLFLGHGNARQRADPGPLSLHRAVLKHRRHRFWPDRLRHRRRARLHHAGTGGTTHLADPAHSGRPAAGIAQGRHGRLSRFLLSLPRSQERRTLCRLG